MSREIEAFTHYFNGELKGINDVLDQVQKIMVFNVHYSYGKKASNHIVCHINT